MEIASEPKSKPLQDVAVNDNVDAVLPAPVQTLLELVLLGPTATRNIENIAQDDDDRLPVVAAAADSAVVVVALRVRHVVRGSILCCCYLQMVVRYCTDYDLDYYVYLVSIR